MFLSRITCTLLFTCSLPMYADETAIYFSEQTNAAGIHFRHTNGASTQKYLPETMGAGCLFFDYDNDGYLDTYLVNSGSSCRPAAHARTQPDEMNVLYRNNGDGTFTDVTTHAGVGDSHWSVSAAFGDYNLDRHLNL